MILTILLIGLAICIIFSVPIAFCLGISAFTSLLSWGHIPLKLVVQRMFTGVDSFPLMAIPFFMLAGELMMTGGILRGLYRFCDALVGHIRGSLGHINVLGSMFFAGITGSAVADAAGLGRMEIGMMTEAGYDIDYSAAITAATATIGPIIPPSIPMVIYAVAAGNVSIAGLFLSGAIPGTLIGVGMMIYNHFVALRKNYPRRETPITVKEFVRAVISAVWVLVMPGIILGGILSGVFTPTEAAAVAVGYAFLVGFFVTRELDFKGLVQALLRAGVSTGVVLFIVATANIFSWVLATQQVPQLVANYFLSISDNPLVFLLLVNIFLLFVGCFMDTAAALIILVPIFAPIASQFGVHPLHFGLVFSLNLIIGLATPPVGLCLFVVCGISKISLERVSKAIWPFILIEIGVLFLVTYVPAIPMALPKLFGYY